MTPRASAPLPPPAHASAGAAAAPRPTPHGVAERPAPAEVADDPRSGSPEDLGRVHAPVRARAPRQATDTSPTYRLLEVKASPPWGFEAVVLRPDGKTSGYFGPTALAARERAEREIADAGGAR